MSRKKMIIIGVVLIFFIALFVFSKSGGNSSDNKSNQKVAIEETTNNILGELISDDETETREELITSAEEIITKEELITKNEETIEPESIYEVETKRYNNKTTSNNANKHTYVPISPVTKSISNPTTRRYTNAKKPTQTTKHNSKQITKSTRKPKPTPTTKKPNNKIPSQKENVALLGKSKTDYIRNMLINNISGTQNTSSKNLAIYMAKKGYSNATTATNKLLGYNTLNFDANTTTVYSPSNANTDIEKAASNAVSKLAGSYNSYGIGINTTFVGNKYKIFIVIVSK